jgi:hypothetical protein
MKYRRRRISSITLLLGKNSTTPSSHFATILEMSGKAEAAKRKKKPLQANVTSESSFIFFPSPLSYCAASLSLRAITGQTDGWRFKWSF